MAPRLLRAGFAISKNKPAPIEVAVSALPRNLLQCKHVRVRSWLDPANWPVTRRLRWGAPSQRLV